VAKNFKDLSQREILALAISSEETDARIYADFAAGLKADYPATAQIFKEMEAEEDDHRRRLIEDYRRRFGEHIPLIRREDVKGFVHRRPVWMIRPLEIKTVRRQAEIMETETRRFYECAASKVGDASTQKLLGDLAEAEQAALKSKAEALALQYRTEFVPRAGR
jgi:erythrin-vacuolar iron transport family protein